MSDISYISNLSDKAILVEIGILSNKTHQTKPYTSKIGKSKFQLVDPHLV